MSNCALENSRMKSRRISDLRQSIFVYRLCEDVMMIVSGCESISSRRTFNIPVLVYLHTIKSQLNVIT